MATKFDTLNAKIQAGTLTSDEIRDTSGLSSDERTALYIGLVNEGLVGGVETPEEQVVVTGTEAAAPTGTWSSWLVQVPSTGSGSITVDGLEVAVGVSISANADEGKTIPSPVIVDGGNNYNWKGYRY